MPTAIITLPCVFLQTVQVTARVHTSPQRPVPLSHPVSSSLLSPTSLPYFGPTDIARIRRCQRRYRRGGGEGEGGGGGGGEA
eukprot:6997686-Pyramimonas_sp.AAC.1